MKDASKINETAASDGSQMRTSQDAGLAGVGPWAYEYDKTSYEKPLEIEVLEDESATVQK